MTEEQWLRADFPPELIKFISRRGNREARARRLRLAGCAALRAKWLSLPDDELRKAVVTAEEYADGNCGAQSLEWQRTAVANMAHWLKSQTVEQCYQLLLPDPLQALKGCLVGFVGRQECDIIRDIFGNPFRPVTFSPSWRTETAVTLARTMYDGREFSAMPILADALQDAGCDEPATLDHCRQPGEHVRGCWVVDLVLALA